MLATAVAVAASASGFPRVASGTRVVSTPPLHRAACCSMNLYELSAKRMDGTEMNMKMLTGSAALAINVASKG